ncbi:hypothetical protein [uncultured Pseudomonas sp.]|uniref:hypothetical protein n=1 Tax=uncultured Pseudomonas sp. TaxID=114707 RepID=UPI0025E3C1CC|nr:hypothetical protein [uncultured Pseudomonas sp.]
MTIKTTEKSVAALLFFVCSCSFAAEQPNYIETSLCLPKENIVFSFKTNPKEKIASICMGPQRSYLVYRYGTQNRIELNYPTNPNFSSWKSFCFNSYVRAGGELNDPKGEREISFSNSGTDYSVYQNWGSENNYEIGILIISKGKSYRISGIPKSQIGSLSRLENSKDLLSIRE